MTTPAPPIAFAGLGAMGAGMALHLLRSGFPVTGYDIYAPSLDRFLTAASTPLAKTATCPAAAASACRIFICMVANSLQATPLLFDPTTGAAPALPENATILICSTVSPAYITEIADRLRDIGRGDARLVDSPVSGGAARAANGTLSIFSSGEEANLNDADVKAVLSCLSAKLYTIPGGLGGGSKAKLIHQIFAGINIAMASEAMGLAAVAGLNTREAFETLQKSEGASWMFGNRVPFMLDPSLGRYSAVTIIAKDVGIITATGRAESWPLGLVGVAEELYERAVRIGWGSEDDCVLVKLYLHGGREELVVERSQGGLEGVPIVVSVEDIKDLMVGVHLVGMAEAMGFCKHLGIDAELMFDIVANAAGATAVFAKYFEDMRRGNWSLRSVPGVEGIRDRMVS